MKTCVRWRVIQPPAFTQLDGGAVTNRVFSFACCNLLHPQLARLTFTAWLSPLQVGSAYVLRSEAQAGLWRSCTVLVIFLDLTWRAGRVSVVSRVHMGLANPEKIPAQP